MVYYSCVMMQQHSSGGLGALLSCAAPPLLLLQSSSDNRRVSQHDALQRYEHIYRDYFDCTTGIFFTNSSHYNNVDQCKDCGNADRSSVTAAGGLSPPVVSCTSL
ncbi:Hypothetical predicted protein [Scomber scombrus]|uniref:Uncharacterized protein n=1 Tax=Scomber scombrus TaxID=13677 RepID=A0AAV1Q1J7_SCOSC